MKGLRQRASPSIRSWLEKHGDETILEMKVCRKPIQSMIEKAANFLSLGKFEENKAALGYDKMFHLFVLIQLNDGKVIKLEKNQVPMLTNASWTTGSDTETVPVKHTAGVSVGELIRKGEKYAPSASAFWQYDAVSQNCQYFIKWCLSGSGLWSSSLEKFVMQDVKSALKGLGFLEKAAKVVTDIAGIADVAMHGEGNKKKRVSTRRRGDDGRRRC
jgi:hypothetical protein